MILLYYEQKRSSLINKRFFWLQIQNRIRQIVVATSYKYSIMNSDFSEKKCPKKKENFSEKKRPIILRVPKYAARDRDLGDT
jgi:hypothetical protein